MELSEDKEILRAHTEGKKKKKKKSMHYFKGL